LEYLVEVEVVVVVQVLLHHKYILVMELWAKEMRAVLVILEADQVAEVELVVLDLIQERQLELLQTQAEMVAQVYTMILVVHLQPMRVAVVEVHLLAQPQAQGV
jgi:hypothetical protein